MRDKPHPVRSAQEAVAIAVSNSRLGSPDADPSNWVATFDNKSNKWTACAGRPKSAPQSAFCLDIDATTGHVAEISIV